jgi:RNA polymerase sigma-70 factor (ECF subfamily)
MNVRPEDPSCADLPSAEGQRLADARLLEQIRNGDAEAAQRFVRDHYPGIYRHLLYLTGRRELAEDLSQETFVHAWRHLDRFVPRAPLRAWLHRIAHREFLQALRGQPVAFLEDVAALPQSFAQQFEEAVELRAMMARLPVEEREALVLRHLEGYTYEEIAEIMGIALRTVKRRLAAARARLQRELGEGDLPYLNPSPTAVLRQWEWLPLEALTTVEARLTMLGVQAFRPGIREADVGARAFGGRKPNTRTTEPSNHRTTEPPNASREASEDETMERRAFLRHAAAGAAGLMLSVENEVVDDRLTRKVSLAVKGMALADLCEQLRGETRLHLVAGNSVADEKVTLFCEKLPLREVMRQLSRPFGYTWLRSGTSGEYRYELVQDLKSQLLEEELRNRDRNAALIALDREMDRYRAYSSLSPDEALARAKTAGPEEKKLLERLGAAGWGPIQMYFRLSPQEQAALRGGQELKFSQDPRPGEGPLPPDIARGVLQARRELRIVPETTEKSSPEQEKASGKFRFARAGEAGGVPPSAVPEARASVTLKLNQTELGRFGFSGSSMASIAGAANGEDNGPYAEGISPAVLQPENAKLNARLAGDPALHARVTLQPQPSCPADLSPSPSPGRGGVTSPAEQEEARVTTADVLEALHRATGLPIVADFYTRLYKPEAVSVTDRPLFEALNQLSDALRLRWNRETGARDTEAWLQFRSMSFYNDRPKEVPNRLLTRWAAGRRERGALTLDHLIEIAGLPDPPLDAREMGEGARLCWGLAEWDLACNSALRPHLRWMASFSPVERQKLQHAAGLRFPELSLPQQQQFITLASGSNPKAIESLAELETAAMQVDYSLPGGFEWEAPEKPGGPPELLAPVRAATREGALAAARQIDPHAELTQIQPTRMVFTLFYRWGTPQANGSLRITTTGRRDTNVSSTRSTVTP